MKGIWIPIEILHDENLTMQEKLVLSEINQLEMLDNGCIATNKHLGEKLKIPPKSVSNTISSLVSKNYIKIRFVEGSRNMTREIYTIHKYENDHPQKMEGVSIKNGESKDSKTNNKTNTYTIHNLWRGYPQKMEGVSIKNGESKDSKTNNKTNTYDDRFLRIWDYYQIGRQKGDKAAAFRAYKKHKIDERCGEDIKIVLDYEMAKSYGKRYLSTLLNNFDAALETAKEATQVPERTGYEY